MLTIVLFAAIVIIGLYLLGRINEVNDRVDVVAGFAASRRDFDAVVRRVAALETPVRAEPVRTEAVIVVEEPPVEERPVEEAPVDEPIPEPIIPPQPTFVPPSVPEITLGQRIRGWVGNDEWEALVGGSILNKIGAILLVIGITLFLGYSFGHVGPAGRATASIALSIALLAAGVRIEKRPTFRIFSRGLIGAGWAALYASAYAIYAIPATQIIANPFAGSIILLAVACGMILHSLHYRVQAVTGITYVAAFAALAIAPTTPFAVLSLIPIAASLLWLAWKFDWYQMALFGIAATYLTCFAKSTGTAPLAGSQSLLLAYWLIFEVFDWARMSRRAVSGGVEWIFPSNAAGFLGMSYGAWAAHAPGQLWLASAYGSALYLASAVVRFRIRRDPVNAGSFEGATLIAAILAGLSIFGRVTGVWRGASLAFEAELVFLAGVALGSVFLRRLSVGAFAISLGSLGTATDSYQHTLVLGRVFWNWTPGVLLHAVLFYINRGIRRTGVLFSSAAAALVALALAFEVQPEWAGAACTVFGTLLIYTGLRGKLAEFRIQGYVLTAGGFLWTTGLCLANGSGMPWMPLAACLALSAIATALLRVHPRAIVGSTAATAILAFTLLWRVVPADYLGIAWCLLSVASLELGRRGFPAMLRKFFLPMAVVTGIGIAATQPTWPTYLIACLACAASAIRLPADEDFARELICVPGVACAAIVAWMTVPASHVSVVWIFMAVVLVELYRRVRLSALVQTAAGLAIIAYGRVMLTDPHILGTALFIAALYCLRNRIAAWAALGPFLALTIAQAKSENLAACWIAGAVGLLIYGTLRNQRDFRLQGYCLTGLGLVAAAWFDLSPAHLAVSIPLVAALYVSRIILHRQKDQRVPMCFSFAASALLAAILYFSVSGHMLTVAWGVEGLILLCAGFGLRDRLSRLQGLALLLLCTLKLFLYDLRNLETPYRILSFIVLGLMLLGVSWTYSRFREQLRKIL